PFGPGDECAFEFSFIPVEPAELGVLGAYDTGDRATLFAAFLDGYHITGFQLEGGDIHHLSIYFDVFVAYQLAGGRTRRRDTHTEYRVIQARFEQFDQVFTCYTFTAGSFLKSFAELLFQDAISVLGFLLFAQLKGVF